MELQSFISRLQELNACLEKFSPDTEGQEITLFPADEIMDIICHYIHTTWKIKMIEYGFNYTDSTVKKITDFFETRVENGEPKEGKKKSSAAANKIKKKETNKN